MGTLYIFLFILFILEYLSNFRKLNVTLLLYF